MATLRPQGPPGRGGEGPTSRSASAIPEATVARLPVYLRALRALAERGTATASSEELAAIAGVNSAKLRKDLSYLGSYGTRGVGYDVEYLIYQISRELGLSQDWPVVIIGIGNLGHALANYGGFVSRGFRIAALLDADPRLSGNRVAGLVIRHIDELEEVIAENGISIAVLAVPPQAAQQVADRLVAAGVTSILNFAPAVVTVPEGVDLRKVDLSIELQILAFHEQRKTADPAARRALRGARAVRRLREDPVNPGEFEDEGAVSAHAGADAEYASAQYASAQYTEPAQYAEPRYDEQQYPNPQHADPAADTEPLPRYGYDEVRPA